MCPKVRSSSMNSGTSISWYSTGKYLREFWTASLKSSAKIGVLATTTSLETLRNTLTRRHSRVREPFNFTWREGDRTLWRVRHGTISSRMGGRRQRNALRKVREDIRWGHGLRTLPPHSRNPFSPRDTTFIVNNTPYPVQFRKKLPTRP